VSLDDLPLVRAPRQGRARKAAVAALAVLGAGGVVLAAWAAIPAVSDALAPTHRLAPPAPVAAPSEPPSCREVWDAIAAHPRWQIRVVDRWASCDPHPPHRVFTIDADGRMTVEEGHRPIRHLALAADELARLRHLGHLSCEPPPDVVGPGGARFIVASGAHPMPAGPGAVGVARPSGAIVHEDSPRGVALGEILDAPIARQDRARLAQLGSVTLDLAAMPLYRDRWSARAARYRVRLGPGEALVVSDDRGPLVRTTLPPGDLVDLAEWGLANPAGLPPSPGDVARGRLVVGGRTIPISATDWWFTPRPLGPVIDRLRDALNGPRSR